MIILMMLPLIGNTQPYGYIDGYILLEKGDTIYGKLKVLTEEQSCSKIKFKNSEQKKIKYKIQEVKSYQRGSEAFVKKNTPQ